MVTCNTATSNVLDPRLRETVLGIFPARSCSSTVLNMRNNDLIKAVRLIMASLDNSESFIRRKVEKEGWTHAKLSNHLQGLYPESKGFSVRSLQRFCSEKNIHKTSRLGAQEVDVVVADAVAKVSYRGRSRF